MWIRYDITSSATPEEEEYKYRSKVKALQEVLRMLKRDPTQKIYLIKNEMVYEHAVGREVPYVLESEEFTGEEGAVRVMLRLGRIPRHMLAKYAYVGGRAGEIIALRLKRRN